MEVINDRVKEYNAKREKMMKWFVPQHPDGPRRVRRAKVRMNNKKHTKCRIKHWYWVTNNVPKYIFHPKKKKWE